MKLLKCIILTLCVFVTRQIRRLKECFNSLDEDGSGSIGVEEISGPLIGLGLVGSY